MTGEVDASESPATLAPAQLEEIAEAEQCLGEFPAGAESGENGDLEYAAEPGSNPDLWLYRDRTMALLWRYVRLAVEVGRLPSLLGREFFRARVSPYSAQTFEDTVIFVHDVEYCLQSLEPADKIVIAMLGLEQYTQEETAQSLRCTRRTIVRQYVDALDRLSEIFLKREILTPLPEKEAISPEPCQEDKTDEFLVSDSG